MEKLRQALYSFLGIIITYLFIATMIFRADVDTEIPYTVNPIINILITIIVWFGIICLMRIKKITSTRTKDIGIVTVFVIAIFIIGSSYLFGLREIPNSDSYSCFTIAKMFLKGDYSAVTSYGSYLSMWPYQTGLIFIEEKIMRVLHMESPLVFQGINLIYFCILYISGYCIISKFVNTLIPKIIYSAIIVTYFPLLFYLVVIYGNLPALACIQFSILAIIMIDDSNTTVMKCTWTFAFIGSTLLASIYKSTTKIYLLALLFALMLTKNLKTKVVMPVIIAVILGFLSTNLTQGYYENIAGEQCGKGMPTSGFLAMGMQDNGPERMPGGWNGYHSNLFEENNYNPNIVDDISKEYIRSRVNYFKNHPIEMIKFYNSKTIVQWTNETYGAFWDINVPRNMDQIGNSFWKDYVYNLKYKKLVPFMDWHELFVYSILLLAMLGLVINGYIKESLQTAESLKLGINVVSIMFIGGFMFSLIWEAQAIAVIWWPILLLPFAIVVVSSLLEEMYGKKGLME